MALKYEIKNFHKEGEKQHVGMTITDGNGHTFLIDKQGILIKKWTNVKAKGHAEKVKAELEKI